MPLTRIQSLGITDGTIVNADINASAAIAGTKLTGVGKVLQVVQDVTIINNTTTSTSFVASGLNVSITPSSASNKVLIFAVVDIDNNASGRQTYLTLFRGATNLTSSNGITNMYGDSSRIITPATLLYLDSPNTTSSTSYEVYYRSNAGGTVGIGGQSSSQVIVCMEIAG